MSKSRKKKAKAVVNDEKTPVVAEVEPTVEMELEAETEPAAANEVAEGTEPEVDIPDEPDPWADLTAERDEYKEKWLRVVAELDNVRKRSSREIVQSRKFAQADVLRAFLEIQDNFERALQSDPGQEDTEATTSFREGVELINQKLRALLKDKGVEPMEVLTKTFDPTYHEAVGQLPREGVESGIVIEVVQPGYHYGDMVLRPARVIISA